MQNSRSYAFTVHHLMESRTRHQTDHGSHPSHLCILHQPCHPLRSLQTQSHIITRQWYIANFARSRARRSPWPSFLQFGRVKAVPLATPAKYLCVIGQHELSTWLHVTCYIGAWQTYRQTEYNTSLPLAGEVKMSYHNWSINRPTDPVYFVETLVK